MRVLSISSSFPPLLHCCCYIIGWLFLWIFFLGNCYVVICNLPQLLARHLFVQKSYFQLGVLWKPWQKIFAFKKPQKDTALFDEFHKKTVEKKRDRKDSGGWQEAERGKRWEYRWRLWSGRKERTGGICGLSRVFFSWMSGWRQMRSTNAVFSVYIKELNQVWDYLSWSWGPCIPSKRTHISGHCSPWPWTVVGFTEPHDKWVFLSERTSPSTPFSQDHVVHMPQHSSKSHWNALFIIDALVQNHNMKPTDRTLNKTRSNTHTSETDIQDRTLKHTEKTTSG